MHSTAVAPWVLLLAVFGATASTATPAPQQCEQQEVQEVLAFLRSGIDGLRRKVSESPYMPYVPCNGFKLFGGKLFPLHFIAKNTTIQRSLCSEEEHRFDFTIPVGANGVIMAFNEYFYEGEDGRALKRRGEVSVVIKGYAIKVKLIRKQSAASTELIYDEVVFTGSSAEVRYRRDSDVPYERIMEEAKRVAFDTLQKISEKDIFPLLRKALGINMQ